MKKILGIISIAILVSSCSNSRLTSSWKNPDLAQAKFKKILVLGLIGEPDRRVREKMEEHMADDLRNLGYDAVTATNEYGPKAFENMKEVEALDQLEKKGIQGVITIVLLDKQKEKYYEPARLRYSPYVIHQDRFWRYYSTMYDRVYEIGYYTSNTKYFWESNFYDLYNWQIHYSAQSQSFDPGSTDALAHNYSQIIVKDMVKRNVLEQQVKQLKSF